MGKAFLANQERLAAVVWLASHRRNRGAGSRPWFVWGIPNWDSLSRDVDHSYIASREACCGMDLG